MKKQKQAQTLMYPFVAAKSMAEMMDFIRKPGWRPRVNTQTIAQMSIAPGNTGKVLSTLRFLGLIDEGGNPTSDFDELKKNYAPTLRRIIREKYRDLFKLIPPDLMTRQRLKGYFGMPEQGADRRTRIFIWFCGEAKIKLPRISSAEKSQA